MTYLRFGIRDLLWAIVMVGLVAGWWLDRERWRQSCLRAEKEKLMTEMDLAILRHQREMEVKILRARFPDHFGTDFEFEIDH